MKNIAKLRACASCEWVFSGGVECPKCKFGSYGAYRIYGNRAYRYAKTQQPWLDRKVERFILDLRREIDAS